MQTPTQKRISINNQLIEFRENMPKEFGCIVFTPDVDSYIKKDFDNNIIEILSLLKRHIKFDYGILKSLYKEDYQQNEYTRQHKNGDRIQSIYKLKDNSVIWIMTSGYGNHQQNIIHDCFDYCYTTVLFPNEY